MIFTLPHYRWLKSGELSGMVVMSIDQLTGYTVDDTDDLKKQVSGDRLKRIDVDDSRLVLYFDEVWPPAKYSIYLPFTLHEKHFICALSFF